MTSGELALAWAAFSEAGRPIPGDFRVYDTPVTSRGRPAMLGIDAEGRRHLLVPVNDSEPVPEDRSGTGIHILSRKLEAKDRVQILADVVCLRPDLNELFDILIADILNAVTQTTGNPALECRLVLERWRELLAQSRGAKLGLEALIGLFGELSCLLRILRLNPAALKVWRGPEKGRHDFLGETCALEVKTRLSRRGRFCEIHGVEQLEPPTGLDLYLAILRIEESGDVGQSVPDILEDIFQTGISRRDLADALAKAGYDLRDSTEYRNRRFSIVEELIYHIENEFPRIVNSSFATGSVPAGVIALAYELDLCTEPPFPLSSQDADEILKSLAGANHV
jgi:hypothetical protein